MEEMGIGLYVYSHSNITEPFIGLALLNSPARELIPGVLLLKIMIKINTGGTAKVRLYSQFSV